MTKVPFLTYFGPANTVPRHALFWLCIYAGYSYMLSFYSPYPDYLLINLVNVPLFMAAYYTLKHFQIPFLYRQKKLILFILSLVVSSTLFFVLFLAVWVSGLGNALGNGDNIPFLIPGRALTVMVRFYSPALVLLAWESHQERRKEQVHLQQLEKEKMENELKFLKAQINPHFLFNTLNNLYSYVLNESPEAPDMIMRLSGILDYVLYKSQKKSVPLHEELDTIQHFIGLEQIRYGKRLQVIFNSDINQALPISPLILLSLVENAFKHGVSGDIDNPRIRIDIRTQNRAIHCGVWNTKSPYTGELNDAYKEGIGLSNIKRQLNLIYPDHHELVIRDDDSEFHVSLTIKPVS